MNDCLKAVTLEERLLSGFVTKKDPDIFFSLGAVEDDFYTQENKVLFRAIEKRARAGQSLELSLVIEDLRKGNLIENAGGFQRVFHVLQDGYDFGDMREAVNTLRELSTRRRLLDVSPLVKSLAENMDRSVDSILEEIQQSLLTITAQEDDSLESFDECLDEHYDLTSRIAGGEVVYLPTGFRDLDNLLAGGLSNGKQFVVVAARSGVGKTAFALQWAVNWAKAGKAIYFVSLEQSKRELMARVAASEAGIDSRRFRQQDSLVPVLNKYESAVKGLRGLPITFDRKKTGLTVAGIASRARRLKAMGKLDAVFIDYLQMIQPRAGVRSGSRESEVATIADDLVLLASQLDIPVIALAQTNREGEKNLGRRPIMTDIRESDRIGQNADLVLALYQDEEETERNEIELLVLKNKQGARGCVHLRYVPKIFRFGDMEQPIEGRPLTAKESRVADAMSKPEPKKAQEQKLF